MAVLRSESREAGSEEAGKLYLPRLLGDGCVLRMGRPVHIWGWNRPGTAVLAELLDAEGNILSGAEGRTAADGRFSLSLPPAKAGGPYELSVKDENGARAVSRDVRVGAVWLVTGQSNIDVDLERCADSCTDVLRGGGDPLLRTFRIEPEAVFSGPREEPASGRWEAAGEGTLRRFSAVGYFFGAKLRELTGLPVGFIQASMGGSGIVSWMSGEMLGGIDELRGKAAAAGDGLAGSRAAGDAAVPSALLRTEVKQQSWRAALDSCDPGLAGNWRNGFKGQGTIQVPGFFAGTPLDGFCGSVWLEKCFEVPREMAGRPAHLWLGTMKDADQTFVNGLLVGETSYQYPPRKYFVPEDCLTAGTNRVVVRLTVERGAGRVTPEKGHFLFSDQGVADLTGLWDYRVGVRMEPLPSEEASGLWACGLFNGMTAACAAFPIDGVVWYQGEADAGRHSSYPELFRRLVEGYRKLWGEALPFLFVQLPNFSVDLGEDGGGWPEFRQLQLQALAIPGTAMAVGIDAGEDCDLHPREKRRIGQRLAYLAARRVYGIGIEDSGPMPLRASPVEMAGGIFLALSHAGGLHARDVGKGGVIRDFQLEDSCGRVRQAEAQVVEGGVLLRVGKPPGEMAETTAKQLAKREQPPYAGEVAGRPAWVRYIYSATYHGALLYNGAGLPLCPFRIPVAAGQNIDDGD